MKCTPGGMPPATNKFNLDTTKSCYESLNILNTFKLQKVNIASTLKMLQQTNANKAPGIDKLPGIFYQRWCRLDGCTYYANY